MSQLEFSILLGSIAATLLNFGSPLALASACAFTITAVAALFYSLALYLWRVRNIQNRRAVEYHDRWGPSVLCFLLLGAVGVSFGFRWAGGDGGGSGLKG